MSTKAEGISCYNKAADDEPLFVLRPTDALAPRVVENWIMRGIAAGVPTEKITWARLQLHAMKQWQRNHPDKVKLPD